MAINEIIPILYRVEINPSAAPAIQGFVNNLTEDDYTKANILPTTFDQSLTVERSNMRWDKIIINLSEHISPLYLVDIDNGGANYTTNGTGVKFTVGYDKPDYLYTYNELFGTTDPTSGSELLYQADAILRQVARVLVIQINQNRSIFNPVTTPNNDNVMLRRNPYYILPVTAEPLVTGADMVALINAAEALITVTQVPNSR